jgi:nicotinamidase-related amidase
VTAKTRLLIIDPQVDFCDGPANGALPVPGAWADLDRLAALVDRLGGAIDAIDVTLDSHHAMDIAHGPWWIDPSGAHPAPFTLISAQGVESGAWSAANPAFRERSLRYVRALEAGDKYALLIWPTHCLIGSPGHAVQPNLLAALRRWEESGFGFVNFVPKGANPFTENYSAIAAEIPDASDPATMTNTTLLDRLRDSDCVLVGGEALSHCVKATVTDIADALGQGLMDRFVLLSDCASAVPALPGGPDFPALARAFVADMLGRGMTSSRSGDIAA